MKIFIFLLYRLLNSICDMYLVCLLWFRRYPKQYLSTGILHVVFRSNVIILEKYSFFPGLTRLRKEITTVKVFWHLILFSIEFLWFCFSVFTLVLVLIERIYQTLKEVNDYFSKLLEVCQKYSTTHCIFNTLIGVWRWVSDTVLLPRNWMQFWKHCPPVWSYPDVQSVLEITKQKRS